MADTLPFWKSKSLEEMSPAEWESLCDGCGRCCLFRVRSMDSDTEHKTDVACRLLDLGTGRCGDYANRRELVPTCKVLNPALVRSGDWLPSTCGYRRVAEGRDLDWWHPLVSGDPDTVRRAGISASGRGISETKAGKLEYHAVSWPMVPTNADGNLPMRWRARFGGTNADLLTPLRSDLSIDIDRMAEHALRLLERGCDGLRILGQIGEGASFSANERIAALEGLARLGVPVSKLLPDAGAGGTDELLRVARCATELGCRGVILPIGRALADRAGTLSEDAIELGRITPLYLDATGPDPSNTRSSKTLRQVQGILATGADAAGLAARVAGEGIEVLGDDTSDLRVLLGRGGAGCVSAIANIACRLPAYVCRNWDDPGAAVAQSVAAAIARCLVGIPPVSGLKALLARQTGDTNWLRVRPPGIALSDAQRASLEVAYDRARAKPAA
jgi:uncharacterized cysteine cluster protein YcgN (CxxCxxCC family)/dihydrodipicolinate synthase/N-acetylneuraminate lyase